MTLEEFELLQEKLLQKLTEDINLLEEEKYNDGMSSNTQTSDSEKNVLNTLYASAKKAEMDKVKARQMYDAARTNPTATQDSIDITKKNYKNKVNQYKQADLNKSNYKYASQIKDEYEVAKEFDDDLNEATSQDIEFANNKIDQINKNISDLKTETGEQTSDLKNNIKTANKEASDDKIQKVQDIQDRIRKQQEQIENANNKKIEQLEKNKEMKLQKLERQKEKLKNARNLLKSELNDDKTSNTYSSEDNTMKEEFDLYKKEQAELEEGIINAIRKMRLNHKEKVLDKLQKKIGKIDIKIIALQEKMKNKNLQEADIAKLQSKIEKLTAAKEKLSDSMKSVDDKYTDLEMKLKEEMLFEEIDNELQDADNLISDIDKKEEEIKKEKENLITPEIKRMLDDDTNDLFLKNIVSEIKTELNKEEPDKTKINLLIIKYGQMKK